MRNAKRVSVLDLIIIVIIVIVVVVNVLSSGPKLSGQWDFLREVPEVTRRSPKEREKKEGDVKRILSCEWSLVSSYVSSLSSVVHIFSRELWFFVPLVEGGGTVISATRRDKTDRQGKWTSPVWF